VEGGDQAGGHTCTLASALLRQRKRRWSELLWFGPRIKRNLDYATLVWAESKEKSGVSRRGLMTKSWRWCDIVACLENSNIIALSELMWFGPRIKRNIDYAAMVWAESKEKFGASRSGPMTKSWRWRDIVACLENSDIIALSEHLLYRYIDIGGTTILSSSSFSPWTHIVLPKQ
jgi:hypothetical protein